MSKFDKLVKRIAAKEGKSPESAEKIVRVSGAKRVSKECCDEKPMKGKKKC